MKHNKPQERTYPSRRIFLYLSLGFLATGLALIFKGLADFLSHSPVRSGPSPFTLKIPRVFPHFQKDVWIVRDEKGVFALSGICPHLGCKPKWHKDRNIFLCPCHGSSFAADGSFIQGPAGRGMARVWINVSNKSLLSVDPNRSASPEHRVVI